MRTSKQTSIKEQAPGNRIIPLQVFDTGCATGPTVLLGQYRVAGVKISPGDRCVVDTIVWLEDVKDTVAEWEQSHR